MKRKIIFVFSSVLLLCIFVSICQLYNKPIVSVASPFASISGHSNLDKMHIKNIQKVPNENNTYTFICYDKDISISIKTIYISASEYIAVYKLLNADGFDIMNDNRYIAQEKGEFTVYNPSPNNKYEKPTTGVTLIDDNKIRTIYSNHSFLLKKNSNVWIAYPENINSDVLSFFVNSI